MKMDAATSSGGVLVMIKELSAIRDQMKWQLSAQSQKEAEIKERESMVSQREMEVQDLVMKLEERESLLKKREELLLECVLSCHTSIEDCIQHEIEENLKSSQLLTKNLEVDCIRIKKDNSRLKDGFTSVCSINEKLKKQLAVEKARSSDMERRVTALQGRLTCLKLDVSAQPKLLAHAQSREVCEVAPQKEGCTKLAKVDGAPPGDLTKRGCVQGNDEHDLLGQLVYHLTQWVTERLVAASGSGEEGSSDSLCTTTFSLLAVLLPTFPVQYHHTCLQFICTALLTSTSKTKSLLSSSLRRIGEVCAASLSGRGAQSYSVKLSRPNDVFCSSNDIRIRVLSALIILQTISQVNTINEALQILKHDLRQTEVQRDFIGFGGVQALLSFAGPSAKLRVLCGAALDIFVLLSSESGLTHFLNDDWFDGIAVLLKDDSLQSDQLEKLSILLQRLAKIRHSKTFFNRSEVLPILRSLLTSRKTLTAFVQLNISSALSNLE